MLTCKNHHKIKQIPLRRTFNLLLAVVFALFSIFGQTPLFAFSPGENRTVSAVLVVPADSDYDGLPDDWEAKFGLYPYDTNEPDTYKDDDGDGLNNLEEYRLGKNPRKYDREIIVALNASPSGGLLDEKGFDVTFTAAVIDSGIYNYDIVKYEWDFDGNGTYDQWSYAPENNKLTSEIKYKYTSAGCHYDGVTKRWFHKARVRVTDLMGQTGVDSAIIYIDRNENIFPPTANPESNAVKVTIPDTAQLNATASDNAGIVLYQWDTNGNGEYDIISTKSGNIRRKYNETVTKSFKAAVKITDTDGLSDIATMDISTDAIKWNNSPYKPKVYFNDYVVYATAGIPVSLNGYGAPQGNIIDDRFERKDYGYAKKLEWDFESDGICDWSNSLISKKDPKNNIWTVAKQPGRADVPHTYGAPGLYRAVLKVETEAGLSATDTVLVIVSASGRTVPTAEATVSYNDKGENEDKDKGKGKKEKKEKTATQIDDGEIPLTARFKHEGSKGDSLKYEWDFDGDKKIDLTTENPNRTCVYHYRTPGYYVASLTVTDINGLTDTCYIPVFARYSNDTGHTSDMIMPKDTYTIAGDNITLICEIYPDNVDADKVIFQYRADGSGIWNTISGIVTPVISYMVTWDTTSVADGEYQIRAIIDGEVSEEEESDDFMPVSIEVGNDISPNEVNIYENSEGNKIIKVDPEESTEIVLTDGTKIYIPKGAIDSGTSTNATIKQLTISAGIGNAIDIKLAGITGINSLNKDITITIPYSDENNDGIVDGTNINENDLVVKWQNPDTSEWEPLYDCIVYTEENFVSGKTNHLSIFGLGSIIGAIVGGAASAGAGGASAALGGVSYCFIATAAYETPMAEDVVILRKFRDEYLIRDNLGRKFVWYYYRYSPPIAKFISDKPTLKAMTRFLLKPLVKFARNSLSAEGGEGQGEGAR